MTEVKGSDIHPLVTSHLFSSRSFQTNLNFPYLHCRSPTNRSTQLMSRDKSPLGTIHTSERALKHVSHTTTPPKKCNLVINWNQVWIPTYKSELLRQVSHNQLSLRETFIRQALITVPLGALTAIYKWLTSLVYVLWLAPPADKGIRPLMMIWLALPKNNPPLRTIFLSQ
jgi:hypothetical protein